MKTAIRRVGIRREPEYKVWLTMRNRCNNLNGKGYGKYGGRGISVCAEWTSFEAFYSDMGPRPSSEHSIDHKDNNGDYCRDNCRWATAVEQSNNRRSNVFLIHDGKSKTIAQLSREFAINRYTLRKRILRGMPLDKALNEPALSLF